MADKGILKKYLEKLGVGSYVELEDDEKRTYDEWEEVLTAEVSLKTIEEFIADQLEVLYKDLRENTKKGEDRQALLATAKIENYEALQAVIAQPQQEREALTEHIKALLDN